MAKKLKRRKHKRSLRRKVARRPRRCVNPTSLARTLISKVAEPGSRFSLTALKAGLRRFGYRNIKGWFDEMIRDALRRRLITPVSKSIYVFTPAAANPCLFRRAKRRKK